MTYKVTVIYPNGNRDSYLLPGIEEAKALSDLLREHSDKGVQGGTLTWTTGDNHDETVFVNLDNVVSITIDPID